MLRYWPLRLEDKWDARSWTMTRPGQDSPVFVFLREPKLKASFLLHKNSKRLAFLLNFKMVFFLFVCMCVHLWHRSEDNHVGSWPLNLGHQAWQHVPLSTWANALIPKRFFFSWWLSVYSSVPESQRMFVIGTPSLGSDTFCKDQNRQDLISCHLTSPSCSQLLYY